MCIRNVSLFSLQTHDLTVGRPEGWTFLLRLGLGCHSVLPQSHTGPHAWWDAHSPHYWCKTLLLRLLLLLPICPSSLFPTSSSRSSTFSPSYSSSFSSSPSPSSPPVHLLLLLLLLLILLFHLLSSPHSFSSFSPLSSSYCSSSSCFPVIVSILVDGFSCLLPSRFCSWQTRVQHQRLEAAAGLEEEGVACCLLREHEAERGDAPLG